MLSLLRINMVEYWTTNENEKPLFWFNVMATDSDQVVACVYNPVVKISEFADDIADALHLPIEKLEELVMLLHEASEDALENFFAGRYYDEDDEPAFNFVFN